MRGGSNFSLFGSRQAGGTDWGETAGHYTGTIGGEKTKHQTLIMGRKIEKQSTRGWQAVRIKYCWQAPNCRTKAQIK